MKLRQWLLVGLIGASIAGWLCIIEFAVISCDYQYYFSKHTLTGPLFRSVLAGTILALLSYPLRMLYSTKVLRKTSAHMATAVFVAFVLCVFIVHSHYNLYTSIGIIAVIACYALIQYLFSNRSIYVLSSFFAPVTHAFSCLILAGIFIFCAVDAPGQTTNWRPNVLLIAIDNALADHLGCYQYHRATSPNIDRLSNEGITYTTFSAEDQTTTVEHSISELAKQLSSDYASCLITNTHSDFELNSFSSSLNFALTPLDDRLSANRFNSKRPRSDRAQVSAASTFINGARNQGRPFFLVYSLQYCTSLSPVPTFARGHFSAPSASPTEKIISEYDECLWYQDRLLSEVITKLDKHDLKEDTIIVVVGTRPPTSFENNKRLPLIIRYPKQIAAGSSDDEKFNASQLADEIKRLLALADQQQRSDNIDTIGYAE
ncbi:MAG: hypothetical protein ACI84O_001327 [Myxococcota bacterium]|jgi:hypothetical protein